MKHPGCTCLLIVAFLPLAHAGELGKLTPGSKPTSLLGGRLQVRLPDAAQVEPRGTSIMSAPESNEDETRAVLDAGKERLVLMAYELYATAGADFEKAARDDLATSPSAARMKLEKVEIGPPLKGLLVRPQAIETQEEANFALGVYVALPDGTVQYLAFYVNPEGAKDPAGVNALSGKIVQTLVAGTRSLATKAGARKLEGLVATVPEGFVATNRQGPDFSVFYLRRLATLGQAAPMCGVYQGGHPSFQYEQSEKPTDQLSSIAGKLLGNEIEWKSYTQEGRKVREAIVPSPTEARMFVHVFCFAGSDAQMQEILGVAESLRAGK